jgi:hypothetical protein
VLDALIYPLRPAHAARLAIGAGFACVPVLVAAVLPELPYVGVVALLISGVVFGTILVFLHSIMESSTRGEAAMPGWPEATSAGELVSGALHVLFPLAVSFLPMIGYWAYVVISVEWEGVRTITTERLAVTAALAAAGLVYLPIATLIFSFWGEWALFNVVGTIRSVARMPGDYFRVVLLLIGLLMLNSVAGWIAARLPWIVSLVFGAFAGLYLLAVAMRAIGLLYHRNRARLGWEG